jgi:hypothetical protein
MTDSVRKGGHFIDPAHGIDRTKDPAFAQG